MGRKSKQSRQDDSFWILSLSEGSRGYSM